MNIVVRPFAGPDLAWAVALNNAAPPAVPETDAARFTGLVAQASHCWIAERDGAPAGLLVLMREGSSYDSDNYLYFADRHASFLYVDRVIVEPTLRSGGVGRALYEAAIGQGPRDGVPVLCCEVNLDPPNPRSLAFHDQLGFERVAERPYHEKGKSGPPKRVAMLERRL